MIADRIIAPIFSLIVAAMPKLLYDVSISFSKEFFKTHITPFLFLKKLKPQVMYSEDFLLDCA